MDAIYMCLFSLIFWPPQNLDNRAPVFALQNKSSVLFNLGPKRASKSAENGIKLGQVGPSWIPVGPTWAEGGPSQQVGCKPRSLCTWSATWLHPGSRIAPKTSQNGGPRGRTQGEPRSGFLFLRASWRQEVLREGQECSRGLQERIL